LTERLADLPPPMQRRLLESFFGAGGVHQMPPDPAGDWHTWLLLGGRGAGKTRAGAEWVTGLVGGVIGIAARPVGRIALVGETFADVRDVMIDGPSGLRAVAPAGERPQ
jgi:phage terminase large subunit-like protein